MKNFSYGSAQARFCHGARTFTPPYLPKALQNVLHANATGYGHARCRLWMRYEPGKNELIHYTFSRRLLTEIEEDETEEMIMCITEAEPAIVLSIIIAAAQKATLSNNSVIREGNWMNYRKEPTISPLFAIKDELYETNGLLYRMNQLVFPDSLQISHKMGHFGKTKNKQMLRAKYCRFPTMNIAIDHILGRCFERHVATKQHTDGPSKPTVIPKKP